MNMLKLRLVFIILVFQVVSAAYTYYHDSNSFDENDKSSPEGGNITRNSLRGGSCNKCGKAYGAPESGRVINGRPVQPVYKYPWIVPLLKGGKMSCGGAIISATYVMTAGHCVYNKQMMRNPQCRRQGPPNFCHIKPNMIKVGILRSNRPRPSEFVAVRRIIGHPKFSRPDLMYDIALLELERPLSCGAALMPICLPPRDFHRIGTKLIIAGYGWNTPEGVASKVLREGEVKEEDPRICVRRTYPINYDKKLICASGLKSGQSSCFGDSGSALFGKFGKKFYAVGIVSHGSGQMCNPQFPVTYHRVYATLKFIKYHVKDLPQG